MGVTQRPITIRRDSQAFTTMGIKAETSCKVDWLHHKSTVPINQLVLTISVLAMRLELNRPQHKTNRRKRRITNQFNDCLVQDRKSSIIIHEHTYTHIIITPLQFYNLIYLNLNFVKK